MNVTITIPTNLGTKTIEGKRVNLPGYEEFSLIIHRSIEAKSKYTITEETTGCSLCHDYDRRTSQAATIEALKAKFERFKMTPELLRQTIETHRKHQEKSKK